MRLFLLIISFYFIQNSFSQLTADFSAASVEVCIGESIDLSDLSTAGASAIESWTWDFGDGTNSIEQNPTHTYAISGTYNITLTIQAFDGSSDFEVKPAYIIVHSLPEVSFTVNSGGCAVPLDVTFNNSSASGASIEYSWDFGNGQSSTDFSPAGISYTAAGGYTIILEVTNTATNCVNSDTLDITVNDFSAGMNAPDTACVGDPVQIDNASTAGSNSWDWSFGDGGISSLENNVHVYATSGTYTINLDAGNSGAGCSDVATQNIVVLPLPIPTFTSSTNLGCAPLDVDFTNTSIDGVNYAWNFGNGNVFVGENPPTEQYSSNGFYDVSLTMTDTNGCSNTIVINNMIEVDALEVEFVADVLNGCAPLDVQFTDNSLPVDVSDPITGWSWDFGNGGSFIGENPPIETYGTGIYDVTLTITTDNGCSADSTYTQYIEVGTVGTVAFSMSLIDSCAKSEFNFTNESIFSPTPDLEEVDYEWDFGDGGTSTDENPTYTYPVDTGYFDVQLIVDYRGCKDTLLIPQMVYIKAPISIFSASSTLFCNPTAFPVTVDFTDNSIIGAIPDDAEMFWTWGDGTFDNLDDPDFDDSDLGSMSHDYATYGTYTIQQAIYNYTTGCEDSTTTTIVISETVADFSISADSTCLGSSVSLMDNSTSIDPFGTYLYEMGNSQSLTGANVTYTYPSSGSFDIQLIATNSVGCSDTAYYNGFDVLSNPVASFTASDVAGCAPLVVDFTNTSTIQGNGVPIASSLWTFYDLSTATTQDANFTFTNLGTYATQLAVTDQFGCVSPTVSVNVSITKPVADFTMDSVVCNMVDYSITSSSGGVGPLSYVWNIDGVTVSNDQTYTGQFNDIETPSVNVQDHDVELIVFDANGCSDTMFMGVQVSMPYANVDYIFDGASVNANGDYNCPPVFANLTDVSSSFGDIASWSWSFGNGNTSIEANSAANTYVFAGTYTLDMAITDQWGCTSDTSLIDYLTIFGPSAEPVWTNIGNFCEPLYEFSINNEVNVDNVLWTLGDGTDVTGNQTFQHDYLASGTYNPQATISDANGCIVVYDLGPITINNNPIDVTVVSSMSLGNANDIFTFSNSTTGGSGPIVEWMWDFTENSFTNSSGEIVTNSWSIPGDHYVVLTVTNVNGCTGVDSVLIQISDVVNVPNVFTPNGDGINDFMILDYNVFQDGFDLVILNRWGNVVHEVNGETGLVLWDGNSMAGKECNDGVYFYKIEGIMFGEEKVKHGNVTLLRGF